MASAFWTACCEGENGERQAGTEGVEGNASLAGKGCPSHYLHCKGQP